MNRRKMPKPFVLAIVIGLPGIVILVMAAQYRTAVKQRMEGGDIPSENPFLSSPLTSEVSQDSNWSAASNTGVEPRSSIAAAATETTASLSFPSTPTTFGAHDVMNGTLPVINDGLTVVTAYFDIGPFTKGPWQIPRSPDDYREWMSAFGGLRTPVVAYFDSDENIKMFSDLRRGLPANLTVVRKVARDQLWTFSLRSKIAQIYETDGYWRHYPNTVVADFATTVNAKYELVRMALLENPFRTRYFSWIDAGYFREFVQSVGCHAYSVCLPLNFRSDSVAYMEVIKINKTLSAEDIVRGNINWVAGGFFVAESSVMLRWTDEYMKALRLLIVDRGIASADQQMLYAIVNTFNISTSIQTYVDDGVSGNVWFQLGYRARSACAANGGQLVTS